MFQAFLEEVDECSGFIYHNEMRWMSQGRVLQRFTATKGVAANFLENELENKSWNQDLLSF
jgi:hypothetical protein